jgi:hypothetical protein
MRKTCRKGRSERISPDEIARLATAGKDVSPYFTREVTVVRPIQRVNVDLTHGMLRDLDERAARLNISRQAVIKTLLSQAIAAEGAAKRRTRKAG